MVQLLELWESLQDILGSRENINRSSVLLCVRMRAQFRMRLFVFHMPFLSNRSCVHNVILYDENVKLYSKA